MGRGAAPLLLACLTACSSVPNAVNPVAWYRDLSGASKNDELDKDARNEKNLEAGGKEPYPNLADVPAVPDRAMSGLDRDALQKSLIADRENAQYTAEQLKAGTPVPGAIIPQAPPPPPPPPKSEAAATPAPAKKQASASPPEPPAPPAAAESSPPPKEAPQAIAEATPMAVPSTPVASAPVAPPPAPPAAEAPPPQQAAAPAAEPQPPAAAPPPPATPPAAPAPATPIAAAAPPAAPPPAAAPPAAPPPVAAQQARPPSRGDTAPPQESQLVSPSVSSVPEGETVAPPPPPPNIPPPPVRTSAAPTQTAALTAPQHPLMVQEIAQIVFADGSAAITGDAHGQLTAVALFQQKSGGAIRIVGHAEPRPGKDALQQQIDGFALALDRAKAVAKVLSDAGVPAQDMMVEAAPTRATDAPRAEIFITR